MNISKFTQKSVEILNNLEKIAYDFGAQEIAQEHLLYGMLTVEDSLIKKLIEKMEIDSDVFLAQDVYKRQSNGCARTGIPPDARIRSMASFGVRYSRLTKYGLSEDRQVRNA